MRISIRTLEVPQRNAAAFSPTLTFGGAPVTAGQLQAEITGCPGTHRIASPRPPALSDGELGGPYNQPSSVAPNWFLPSIYFTEVSPTSKFHGKVFGDNVMPVPAGDSGRVAVAWQYRTRVGGRTATPNVRPFTQWPIYGGGQN